VNNDIYLQQNHEYLFVRYVDIKKTFSLIVFFESVSRR